MSDRASSVKLSDTNDFEINPATSDNQTNGNQKTQIVDDLGVTWNLEDNGAMPVNVQDQTTDPIILPMAQLLASTTLTLTAVIGEYTITLASAVGFTVGDHIRIIDNINDRFYFGTILAINALTITLDTPLDFAYLSGSEVTASNINMAVDGSVTPVVFTLRTGTVSIPSEADITRMIFSCVADTAVDLSLFGNLPALLRGVVFRRVDGKITNIFNVKTNGEIANIDYDFTIYAANNPAQGIDGFTSRLTFAGQNKIGVALRTAADDNLEILIQDDLRSLVNLTIILEGHVVAN